MKSRWWYLGVLWPLPVTLAFAIAENVLYQSHCGPVHTVSVIFSLQKHPTACTRLTLLADVPSLLLGVSATIAAWLYGVGHQSWKQIPQDLEAAEVLLPNRAYLFDATGNCERRLEWVTTSVPGRLLTAVAVLILGVVFYAVTFDGAHLFHDYAAGEHLRHADIRALWWANWHRYPLLAAMWIIVGSAGVYWAALDLLGFIRRALTLGRLSTSSEWRFVAAPSRGRHPWDSLLRLTNLRVWGFVTFMLTFVDLIYLARASHAGGAKNIVLGGIAMLVLLVTVVPSRLYFRAVQNAYESSIERERKGLRELAATDADYRVQSYVALRRLELSMGTVQPSLSAVARITGMAVQAATLAGFLASVVTLGVG